MKAYNFPCGCSIPVDESLPDVHGHPSLIYPDDVNELPLDCPTTWKMLGEGHTKGVFQLESPLGRQWCKRLKPENIEHMAALGALLRPGCLKAKDEDGISMTEHYCRRKNNEEEVTYFHPALEPLLNKTYGVLTYQEQAMAIAVALAGFTPMEADDLRKCVTDDTMFVSKTRGWISIRTLLDTGYGNEEFLVMDRVGNQCWKPIKNIWCTGKHDVTRVESDSGFGVWATRYHQFDTSTGWKARNRLQAGDSLIACRNINYDGRDEISSDMALVVAGIVCEGYFVENQSTFVNHDISMMKRFVSAYKAAFGKTPSLHSEQKVAYISKEERDKIAKFVDYGLSDSRRLPQEMMGMSLESTARFLSYMLACEGGVAENGQFEFASKSYTLAWQVKLLLLRFGIRSLLLSYPDRERYRLYVNDQVDQRLMFDLLTSEWSTLKWNSLSQVLDRKRTTNFTTDTFPSHLVVQMIDQYPTITNGEGGSVYSQPLSRERFLRLAEKTGDAYWVGLARGNQCYDPVVSLNQKRRQIETYDFTVDDDTPFIVANGIVIHNSIGKKKTDLMAKVKAMSIEKAAAKGIVTPEEWAEIFGWIEKSQRYSFNRCVSFDTKILRPNGGKHSNGKDFTVEEMYQIRNDIEYAKATGHHSLYKKWKLRGNYGKGLSIGEDDRIRPNTIVSIQPAGFRKVYKITLENGATIRVTENHKFPTSAGEMTVSQMLDKGQKITLCVCGDYQPTAEKYGFKGYPVLPVRISSIRQDGECMTYDVTMEAPNHTFVVDSGIVTCNSHAVSYGMIGYHTAHAKAHFPLQFYTSFLFHAKEKQDPLLEIRQLVNDAKVMGIEVLPPRFADMKCNFSTDGVVITFGLADVKGIGQKQIPEIRENIKLVEREIGTPCIKWKWNDFLFYFADSCKSTAVKRMIEVGAMRDYHMERQRMLAEYDVYSQLTEREKKQIAVFGTKVSGLEEAIQWLIDIPKGIATAKRRDKVSTLLNMIRKPPTPLVDTPAWVAKVEEECLGIPITCNKIDGTNRIRANITCSEYREGKGDEPMVFAVEIQDYREVRIQNGDNRGRVMTFLTIGDGSGSLEDVTMFADAWAKYGNMIYHGSTVELRGRRDPRRGSLIVEEVWKV